MHTVEESAAMYGEDSSGRKVSLLNDSTSSPSTTTDNNNNNNIETSFTKPTLHDRPHISISSLSSCCPSRGSSSSSRSSFSSSSRRSPPTPPPVSRFDSRSSLNTQSPLSPMTPSYGFDPMDQQKQTNGLPYYPYNNRQSGTGYPSLNDATSQPYYNLSNHQSLPAMNQSTPEYDSEQTYSQRTTLNRLQTQHLPLSGPDLSSHQFSPSQNHNSVLPSPSTILPTSAPDSTVASATSLSTPSIAPSAPEKPEPATPTSASSTKAPVQGKKKYPCPHAIAFKCTDTFTTSGHAARHGRKHTGEKNVVCPTCKKAFTRKDNMKQHERTHKGGSSAGMPSPSLSAKSVGGRRSSTSSVTTVGGDPMDMDTPGPATNERPKMQRSELSEILENVSAGVGGDRGMSEDLDGEGESPGLDALASAAAGAMNQD